MAQVVAWRGFSAELAAVLLGPAGPEQFGPSRVVGLAALHVAVLRNQAHLLPLLWPRSARLPYSGQLYTGARVEVSLTQMSEGEDLTDATLAALLSLTADDAQLQQYHLQQQQQALAPKQPPSNSSNRSGSGGGNNNNNDDDIELAASVEHVPTIEDTAEAGGGAAGELLCTGVLVKNVKAGLFRKYTQQRLCSLLRGEQPVQHSFWLFFVCFLPFSFLFCRASIAGARRPRTTWWRQWRCPSR